MNILKGALCGLAVVALAVLLGLFAALLDKYIGKPWGVVMIFLFAGMVGGACIAWIIGDWK